MKKGIIAFFAAFLSIAALAAQPVREGDFPRPSAPETPEPDLQEAEAREQARAEADAIAAEAREQARSEADAIVAEALERAKTEADAIAAEAREQARSEADAIVAEALERAKAGAAEISAPKSPRAWGIKLDATFDAVLSRSFFDDYASREAADKEGSPYTWQGDGDLSAFQSGFFDDALEARASFSYTGEKLGGLLMIKADSGQAVLGDFELWLRPIKYAKAWAGNTAQRGTLNQYQNFDDFLRTKIAYLGIMIPEWKQTRRQGLGDNADAREDFPYGYSGRGESKGFAVFTTNDAADLLMPAGSFTRRQMGLLFEGNYSLFSLQAQAGGLFQKLSRAFVNAWEGSPEGAINYYDPTYDTLLLSSASYGLRLEGAKIAGILNLAAVYKYADSFTAKYTANASKGYQIWEDAANHSFSLFANIDNLPWVPNLGVTLGYSGLFQKWENPLAKNTKVPGDVANDALHFYSTYEKVNLPYYSGIDLRFCYTGIQKLTLTFNNNFSFASVDGIEQGAGKRYAAGWAYTSQLNANGSSGEMRKENYFGMYNALGADYRLTGSLTAQLQIANQLGVFTLDWEDDPCGSVSNYFGVYGGAWFTIYEKYGVKGSLRGGLSLKLNSFSFEDAARADKRAYKAGYLDFGIPFGLKLEY